ncbi:MAG: hypothetical protein IJ329_01865 [Clostridia bacterium]|nr:hypothetical protein [Clostridia bacterium]
MKAVLNDIFSDHAVFAANKPIRIFGRGQGKIEGVFQGEKAVATIMDNCWILEFSPRSYGGPYTVELFLDGEKKILSDVYVGEVLLCSGQSNMHFKLSSSTEPKENYKNDDSVRLFIVDRLEEGERFFSENGWLPCTKENAAEWTAIGYYVAHRIAKEKGCAVGVVACCQGASVIEAWLPQESLPNSVRKIPTEQLHPDHTLYPWNPTGTLYEKMLSTVIPYAFSCVVWYQGESNAFFPEAETYAETLTAMIMRWRKDFLDEKLPFRIVQIADYALYPFDKAAWETIQKEQLAVPQKLPFVETVVSRDVCETDDIHPPTKSKLSLRIANSIL